MAKETRSAKAWREFVESCQHPKWQCFKFNRAVEEWCCHSCGKRMA